MTSPSRKVLAKLLDRVAEAGDQLESIFKADEVLRWPVHAIEHLSNSRLLKPVTDAESVVCRECDERCHHPVTLDDTADGRPPTLYSTCELFADRGPFELAPERLKRWASSRELVARFVGRGISAMPRGHDDHWRRVHYGTVETGTVRRLLSVEFVNGATVRMGSVSLPLIELLDWEDTGIALSRDPLALAAAQSNDLQSGNKRTHPSTTVRDDNKQLKALRDRRLQRRLDALAREHPKLSKEQLATKLAKSEDGEGLSAGLIARITRMPD